jgi:hypothetical protein
MTLPPPGREFTITVWPQLLEALRHQARDIVGRPAGNERTISSIWRRVNLATGRRCAGGCGAQANVGRRQIGS